MANETGWIPMDGLEEWWWIRQDVNKVTEQAVRRVQDDSKKAQQVGQQIKKDKAINAKFAQFLGFLLKKLDNDKVVKWIYEVFFKTKHPKTNVTYLRKNINTIIIVWIFAPFYNEEIKKLWLEDFFLAIYDFGSWVTLSKYTQYLKKLSLKYHDNVPIDKSDFLGFLIDVFVHYDLLNTKKLDNNEYAELKESLSKELYEH